VRPLGRASAYYLRLNPALALGAGVVDRLPTAD
jgi:hypothetical protein